jgi:hypothetical protein
MMNGTSLNHHDREKRNATHFIMFLLVLSFAGLMLLSSVGNAIHGIYESQKFKTDADEYVLKNYHDMNITMIEGLSRGTNPEIVLQYAPYLEKYHLSVFHD